MPASGQWLNDYQIVCAQTLLKNNFLNLVNYIPQFVKGNILSNFQ